MVRIECGRRGCGGEYAPLNPLLEDHGVHTLIYDDTLSRIHREVLEAGSDPWLKHVLAEIEAAARTGAVPEDVAQTAAYYARRAARVKELRSYRPARMARALLNIALVNAGLGPARLQPGDTSVIFNVVSRLGIRWRYRPETAVKYYVDKACDVLVSRASCNPKTRILALRLAVDLNRILQVKPRSVAAAALYITMKAACDEPASMNVVADAVGVTTPTISKLLAQLRIRYIYNGELLYEWTRGQLRGFRPVSRRSPASLEIDYRLEPKTKTLEWLYQG